ncbi:hypothetical protein QBC33DRAFT_450610 [Phialemonium atrogriseum]|uniref:Uncharacterized protein n=1 Tax=Phialemonium atrogriseum TaxID=1093897 RepID=A0AAJ0C282_9PEZI|nr:uncharacterized protein QBC33DRAFT_450610 [Phialemonium atrogriseum]KAK1767748.1 hypothetical protein QBC33DRAFT_450610 [Phialemonium atrogriseum]
MANTPDNSVDTSTPRAAKDKHCPYCGQAFTSSSLGRHLDLYIKEKNPKPPDGVHDVEAIKKLRGGITRRQPRASLARRATSTPTGTPATSVSRRSPASDDAASSSARTPAAQKGSNHGEDAAAPRFPFITPWEATGVINDIPKNGEPSRRGSEVAPGGSWLAAMPPQPAQRAMSRQIQKSQFDMKQKVQDASDTARAAELALREMIGSWRAAKYHIDMHSMPFEFEPLALDFPALTLQCLQPPPTLFSSTQHPTTTSWSISPPDHQQYEALRTYFAEEFRKWRITCETVTTAVNEDLQYPPSSTVFKCEAQEAAHRGLKVAETLERQVDNHLQTTFTIWEGLPAERRNELWVLELARSVGKKQHEMDKLKETQHNLRQENANLKSHVEHLNRLQQPREFKISPPTTVPVGPGMVAFMQEEAVVHGRRTVGLNIDDRHLDLGTIVSSAIERWKNVIVSTRSTSGLDAQRPLEQAASAPPSQAGSSSMGTNDGNEAAAVAPGSSTQAQNQVPQPRQHHAVQAVQDPPRPGQHHFGTRPKGYAHAASRHPSTTAPNTNILSAPPSVVTTSADHDDEISDQDADAEMEDDDGLGFPAMNAAPEPHQSRHQEQARQQVASMPEQHAVQLDVPRTRGAERPRFAVIANSTGRRANSTSATHVGHGGMELSRSTSPMNVAMQWKTTGNQQQVQPNSGLGHGRAVHADMGMAMHVVGGEPMYTD